ncbi:MAG: hypothetical protein AAFO69_10255 [Bacteroidota bacterium]
MFGCYNEAVIDPEEVNLSTVQNLASAVFPGPAGSETFGEHMEALMNAHPDSTVLEFAEGKWNYTVTREQISGWDLHHVTYFVSDEYREMFWRQPAGTTFSSFGSGWKALFDFPGAGCKSAAGNIACGGLTHYQDFYDAGFLHIRFKQREGNVGMSDSGARVLLDFFFEEIFTTMPLTGHWAQGFSGGGGTIVFLLEDLDAKNTDYFDGGVVICASPTSERIDDRTLVNTIRTHNLVVLFHANDGEQAAYLRRVQNMGAEFVDSRDSGSPYAYGYPMIRDFDAHNASIRYPSYAINHGDYLDSYVTQAGDTVVMGWKTVIADGLGTLDARLALRARADAGLAPVAAAVPPANVLAVGDAVTFTSNMLINGESAFGVGVEILHGSTISGFDDQVSGFARRKAIHSTLGTTIQVAPSVDYPANTAFEVSVVLGNDPNLPRKSDLHFGSAGGLLIDFSCGVSEEIVQSFVNSGIFYKADDSCYSNSHHILIKEITITRLMDQ